MIWFDSPIVGDVQDYSVSWIPAFAGMTSPFSLFPHANCLPATPGNMSALYLQRELNAMAHPTRLFIVDELSRGERCVCELTDMVGADVSTISKHLAVLKNAGIVRDEKRGSQVWYSLRCPCVMSFFNCVEEVIMTTAEEEIHKAKCSNCC